MKFSVLICFLFLCTTASPLLAQVKYEKEYRIEAAQVPPSARQFVDSLRFNRRVRWYVEVGLTGKSVEAKSKYRRRRYSVEFDTTGTLQDVEIDLAYRKVPEEVQDAITKHLEAEFAAFSIVKTQEQLTGPREKLIAYLTERGDKSGLTTKYELVVKGWQNDGRNKFEYTFSEDGEFEYRREIVFRNTDNLEY